MGQGWVNNKSTNGAREREVSTFLVLLVLLVPRGWCFSLSLSLSPCSSSASLIPPSPPPPPSNPLLSLSLSLSTVRGSTLPRELTTSSRQSCTTNGLGSTSASPSPNILRTWSGVIGWCVPSAGMIRISGGGGVESPRSPPTSWSWSWSWSSSSSSPSSSSSSSSPPPPAGGRRRRRRRRGT